MARCSHKGCGQEFDPKTNTEKSCTYHAGGPVFHEGLKSWSCCSDVNKPVLDFDEFMSIPGCTIGKHDEAPAKPPSPPPKPAQNPASLSVTTSNDGTEVYASGPAAPSAPEPLGTTSVFSTPPAPVHVEEEDDLGAQVKPGTKCRHNGCSVLFVSDEVNRKEGGEASECTYHPLPPIFREGSKGYLCCKRRVLEFDEFLKIEGCKKGRHVFVAKAKPQEGEQFTECRIDHFQTPSEVHVSVYGKQADKDRSKIEFEETKLHIDIFLPGPKRFRKSIELFGPIDPDNSSYKFFGTKVDILLKKQDTRSWTILEKPQRDLGPVSLTFGVGGRTGTIGGKDIILDESNKSKSKVTV